MAAVPNQRTASLSLLFARMESVEVIIPTKNSVNLLPRHSLPQETSGRNGKKCKRTPTSEPVLTLRGFLLYWNQSFRLAKVTWGL